MKKPKQKKVNTKNTVTKKKENLSFFSSINTFKVLLFCIAVTALIYGSNLSHKIVFLDDDMMMDNLKILHENEFNIFTESFERDAMVGIGGDLYRPVQTFFLIALYNSENNTLIYFQLFQLLLHAIAGTCIFLLLMAFKTDKRRALLLAMLYLCHPLFTSLPSFIPAMGDQMLVIFAILSFIIFVDYLESPSLKKLLLHILSFTFAVFTKETALVLPGVFIVYALLFKKFKLKPLIIPLLLWIGIPVIYMILRQHTINPALVAPHNQLNFTNSSANFIYNIPSIFEFISKFVLPINLSFLASFQTYRTIIGIAFILILFLGAYKKIIDFKYTLFSFAWYLAFIIPPMLYTNPVFDYGEHRGFLPLIAFLIVIASLKVSSKIFTVTTLIITVLLASLSMIHKSDFKDPINFYTHIIENDPVPIAYLNRGAYLHKNKGDIRNALSDYNKAIELKNDYHTALYNRSLLKSELMKDIPGALIDLQKAIEAKPNYAEAFYQRGYLKFTALNMPDEAICDIDTAIIMNPSFVLAYNNRGIMKLNYLKDTTAALADFTASINSQPEYNATPYFYRGLLNFYGSDPQSACPDWMAAAKYGNTQAENLYNTHCIKNNGMNNLN